MTVRNLSPAAYRALDDYVKDEGPWALENRGPRDQGGSGNYYANRGTRILGIVFHITAGITDFIAPDLSAESVTNYGRTTTREASWSMALDSDSIIPSLQEHRVAWVHGVPGYNFNRPLYGIEIGKREPDWRGAPQPWVDAVLLRLAVVCAPRVKRYGIPLRLMTNRDEIQALINAGKPVGFTEHWRLTPETRSDAGRVGSVTTFPWERFFTFLRRELALLDGTTVPSPPPATPLSVRNGTVLTVTAVALNVRRNPNTTSAIDGVLKKGQRVTATGRTSNGWVQIKYGTKLRWVNSAWLRVYSQPKPKPPATTYPVLRLGSTGSLVKQLQSFAMRVFPAYAGSIRYSGGADGSFGPGTEAWVEEFQRRTGLVPDGSVGPLTWAKLIRYGFPKP